MELLTIIIIFLLFLNFPAFAKEDYCRSFANKTNPTDLTALNKCLTETTNPENWHREKPCRSAVSGIIGNQATREGYCGNIIENICTNSYVEKVAKIQKEFASIDTQVFSNPILTKFFEKIGPTKKANKGDFWTCTDLLFEFENNGDMELKMEECFDISRRIKNNLLYSLKRRKKAKEVFDSVKMMILSFLREQINYLDIEDKLDLKRLSYLNNMIRIVKNVSLKYEKVKPRWNMSASPSKSAIVIEGMIMLVDYNANYLKGLLIHEFGHIIGPAESFIKIENGMQVVSQYDPSYPFDQSLSCLKKGIIKGADLNCLNKQANDCDDKSSKIEKAICKTTLNYISN